MATCARHLLIFSHTHYLHFSHSEMCNKTTVPRLPYHLVPSWVQPVWGCQQEVGGQRAGETLVTYCCSSITPAQGHHRPTVVSKLLWDGPQLWGSRTLPPQLCVQPWVNLGNSSCFQLCQSLSCLTAPSQYLSSSILFVISSLCQIPSQVVWMGFCFPDWSLAKSTSIQILGFLYRGPSNASLKSL